MKQGRGEEAKSTIIRLHGGQKNAKLDAVEAEFQEMQLQIDWGMPRGLICLGDSADEMQRART